MKHLYHWVSAVAWEKRAEEMAGVGVTTVQTLDRVCYWPGKPNCGKSSPETFWEIPDKQLNICWHTRAYHDSMVEKLHCSWQT